MPTYHSSLWLHSQARRLLREAGVPIEKFALAIIKGKPAKTKNAYKRKGNKLTLFCSESVIIGYIL